LNSKTFFHFMNLGFSSLKLSVTSRRYDVDSLYKIFKWVTWYLNVFQGENLHPGIWTNFMHLCWKMQKTYKFWNYILTLLVRIIMFDVPRSDLLNSTTGKFGRLLLSRRIKGNILSLSVSLSKIHWSTFVSVYYAK